MNESRSYGYNDLELISIQVRKWNLKRYLALFLAFSFIVGVWLAMDQKLLFGKAWLSETYDNEDWRTNEGNLHTFGAWDLEAHIWKTEWLMENFPNYHWNPYWYLGMPLLKYYQSGFYFLHWLVTELTNLSTARSALLMIIFSHLIAALLTFLVCYKISRRIWVSALCSSFVISNTFITLRSYGWEPITVMFLFLYPLGLLLFLQEPLRPFRFWLIIVLGVSYISHPLLWFSLCMTIGIYLLSIAVRRKIEKNAQQRHYILEFIGAVIASLLIGAIQFLPQLTYEQATSGAHMGVKYLPYYQVPFNIISLKDFLFDAANLKGPGPIVMIAFLLLVIFSILHYYPRKNVNPNLRRIFQHELVTGLAITLFIMVLFYYMEFYNVFPMNILRSIQYHRIIPEFVITAAILVAAMSNLAHTHRQKVLYYTMLVAFVAVGGIIIYIVQSYWVTTDDIMIKPEFIYDKFDGRISFPYTDQSLAVRNSFTEIPQAYGYYEQGITNAYNDEIFSVSSGFHNADLTMLYLKAANIERLYVNMEEGERDAIIRSRLQGSLPFVKVNNSRYSYFELNLKNPQLAQAIDSHAADQVQTLRPKCRILFKEKYCGSAGEEFVSTDLEEVAYLRNYVGLLESDYKPKAGFQMDNPNVYFVHVDDAATSTAVVVKMTFDSDFVAEVNGHEVPIEPIGPDFMLISPGMKGDYTIKLQYKLGLPYIAGLSISILSLALLSFFFILKQPRWIFLGFPRGDMA